MGSCLVYLKEKTGNIINNVVVVVWRVCVLCEVGLRVSWSLKSLQVTGLALS